MASIGHVMVGAAAARFGRTGQRPLWAPLSSGVVWSFLSLLPDGDVIGFRLGVAYADPWGHRGATHSFAFALLVAAVVWIVARVGRVPATRTSVIALVVVASHGLLDTLTDGGLGCALLWPFSNRRFFAPWTPLPVAPIGRAFASLRGLQVALVELVLLSPLVLYTFWPRRGATRG
jgi:inner membrane protein